jgi:predicted phage terminase large subunit-like protein
MVSAGIGGPITGEPGNLFLIDDPVKNAEEAFSPTTREAHWEWWLSVAKTRLHQDSSVVLLMTRWHEGDLGGRLVADEGFEEIRLPALAEENDPLGRAVAEALWPEEFPADYLQAIRDSPSGIYWFAAQYQGRPTPRTGGMFERDMAGTVDAAPAGCKSVRWWDLAAGKKAEKADPDWTVGLKLSRADNGMFYVEDVRRGRWRAKELEERMRNTASEDGLETAIWIEEEPGSEGSLYLEGTLIPLLAGYNARSQRSTGDKVLRAEPASAQWSAGNMKLVKAPWNEAFKAELELFPRGTHDDQVDGLSGAFSKLAPPEKKKARLRFRE